MKKKYQTLVVSTSPEEFREKCERLLGEGWGVIPESIRSDVAVSAVENRSVSYRQFIAFFELSVNE